jgi:hypothetical protein
MVWRDADNAGHNSIQGDKDMTHTETQQHDSDGRNVALWRTVLPSLLALSLLAACLALTACDDGEPSGPMPQVDTTSHTFEWFTDTLGAALSTVNDVYCVSENDAWAVGEFYYRDPETGQRDRSRDANAAHWDGEKWTMHRINTGGSTHGEIFAIEYLSSDNIWSDCINWDGYRWVPYYVTSISTGATRKIWGDRPDNVYFVGYNGSLMRWDGATFTQLDGSTTAGYCDVWGWKDTMYVAVSDYDQLSGRLGYLLRYEGGAFKRREIFHFDVQIAVWGMHGTWYAGGCSPLYRKTGGEWRHVLSTPSCITGIRGTSLNNIYVLVQFGQVIHYNGSTFATVLPPETSGNFFSRKISTAGPMVLACGRVNGYALIKRGYQKRKE